MASDGFEISEIGLLHMTVYIIRTWLWWSLTVLERCHDHEWDSRGFETKVCLEPLMMSTVESRKTHIIQPQQRSTQIIPIAISYLSTFYIFFVLFLHQSKAHTQTCNTNILIQHAIIIDVCLNNTNRCKLNTIKSIKACV